MNDLISQSIATLPAEYRGMLERVQRVLPALRAGAENFHKSASQFKIATLDITPLTPIRTARQILAECERTRQALEEAHIKTRRHAIELRRREARLAGSIDPLDRELCEVEILELQWQGANIENAMRGAVRKLAYLAGQYQGVLRAIGKDHLTEEDFEREEARYHVMTAFRQAWIAANARGGAIDEGNLIYLFDLGIPLGAARAEVLARYELERDLLAQGKTATHESTLVWLGALADRFAANAAAFADRRHLAVLDQSCLVRPAAIEED